jgi:FKBP-type peptidyl-prolyl cis-trans isomerase
MAARNSAHLLLVTATLLTASCEKKVPEPEPAPRSSKAEAEDTGPKKLIKEDLEVGDGPEAKRGDKVKVHYTGRLLKTNFKFDSSVGKDPLPFTIGEGAVIKGWDEGVVGMKVGGKRKLTIPADLAYGEAGKPPDIPANAPLVFEVELLGIGGEGDGGSDGDDSERGDDSDDPGDILGEDLGDHDGHAH